MLVLTTNPETSTCKVSSDVSRKLKPTLCMKEQKNILKMNKEVGMLLQKRSKYKWSRDKKLFYSLLELHLN